MHRPSTQRLALAAATAIALFSAGAAQAGPYSALYVFGDSLSDDGNNSIAGLNAPGQVITGNSYIPTSTYASGVYSNGPVWATYYASMLGLSLTPSLAGGGDYAFGGAVTSSAGFPYSLTVQAGQYLSSTGGTASSSALYVVAGGGNNARATLTALATAPAASAPGIIAAAAAAYAADIGNIVDELQAAGAQHIVVWDTPNLGLSPAVEASGFGSAGSFVATAMNGALASRLAGEAGVSTFDIYGLGTTLASNGAAYGFSDVGDACGAVAGADCSQYVYWDGIHPTTAGHEAIAEALYAATVPVPEPGTWALMAGGLGVLGWVTRRRRSVASR